MRACLTHICVIHWCLFIRRSVLKDKGSAQWKNFSEADYNFNVRTWRRWMKLDKDVCAKSPSLLKLPDTNTTYLKRKVKASDSSATPEPVRKRYKVADNSDDEWE